MREVQLIAAEDTRRSAKLLLHFGVGTGTVSFHAHNWRGRLSQLMQRLHDGQSIALVTDAGTPGISDPGVELVRACLAQGIRVDPVPGVSAPLAAAMVSGFALVPLTIFGFAPSRSKDRKTWLMSMVAVRNTFTFFETPHRIRETLHEASLIFGERPLAVCRELTKLHQELLHGTASGILEHLESPRGEFTIVVGPADGALIDGQTEVSDDELASEFGRLIEIGAHNRRQAISALAKRFRRPAREVYAAVERVKG